MAPGHPGRPPLALGEGRAPRRGRSHGQGTAPPGWGRDLRRHLPLPLAGGGAPRVGATALPQVTDGQVLGAVVVVAVPRLGQGGGGAEGRGQRDERGRQQVGCRRGGALLAAAAAAPGPPVRAQTDGGGGGRVWQGKNIDSDQSQSLTTQRPNDPYPSSWEGFHFAFLAVSLENLSFENDLQ